MARKLDAPLVRSSDCGRIAYSGETLPPSGQRGADGSDTSLVAEVQPLSTQVAFNGICGGIALAGIDGARIREFAKTTVGFLMGRALPLESLVGIPIHVY
jgi:hypothetical protein